MKIQKILNSQQQPVTVSKVNKNDDQLKPKNTNYSDSNKNRITIKKFPLDKINTKKDGKRVLIIGMSGSGKSVVTLNILNQCKDIPVWMVISPSESRNHTYEKYVHPGCIHDDLTIEALQAFRSRQEHVTSVWQIPNTDPIQYRRDPSAGIILDDINISAKLFKDDIFRWAYFNSRHDKTLWIQLTQYFMSVPIDHRQNTSFLFIFRQNSPKQVKKIYDEFANVFDNFKDFKQALDLCTADYRCMVIDCLNPSTNIEDRIFWYKANSKVQPFKAGAKWWYKQMDKLYNKNWNQPKDISNKCETVCKGKISKQRKESLSNENNTVKNKNGNKRKLTEMNFDNINNNNNKKQLTMKQQSKVTEILLEE